MRFGVVPSPPVILKRAPRIELTRPVSCRASPRADRSHTTRPRTLYGLLGIKSSATLAEIRTAYRNAARRLHPDANASPAAVEEFQRIKAAYEVLCDSRLRKQYDNVGLSALGPQYAELSSYLGAGAARRAGGGTASAAAGRPAGGGVRGRDVHTVLGLLLSEAAQGAEKVVTYEAMGACLECEGSGYASHAPLCPVCRGTGQVLRSEWVAAPAAAAGAGQGGSGGIKHVAPAACPACGGSGEVAQPQCKRCSGRGRCRVVRELAVRVPGGVERGALLRVAGEGGAGRCGGPPGDLLVRLEVYSDPNLRRVGDDLHSEVAVDVWLALLGGSVAVDSVRGRRLLEVPAGSQQGDVLRLAGAGVARVAPGGGGGLTRGDHVFTLRLRLPSAAQLCGASRDLLARLAACDSTLRGGQPAG